MSGVRVTHGMMTDRLVGDVRRSNAEIARTTAQISSQRRINTAADDPTGTRQALRLRADLAEIDANIAGTDAAKSWTSATETALGSMTDIVHRVRELVLQASNGTMKASDRQAIAGELGQYAEQLKSLGNAKVGDAYVFSGQNSQTAPYAPGASDAYAGDGLPVARTIGPGQSVQVNVSGGDVLGGGAGDGKLLDTVRSAMAFMTGGTSADLENLRTTTLSSLDRNLDTVLSARSAVGATANRVELAESRLQDTKLAATDGLSKIEDVDVADAMIRLSSQKTAYQAALSAGANVIQTSLMDFLR